MSHRTPPPTGHETLLSLQVLRAAAALLVLLHHAAHDADAIAARTGTAALAPGRYVDLVFGVHLFFVISGFIMLRTARGFGSARGAGVFALRRLARVAPLYWLLTSLTLAGGIFAPALLDTPRGGAAWVLGSYLFVPVSRHGGPPTPVLGQGWTLNYEMFFYGLFAVAMLFPRRIAVAGLAGALVGLAALGRAVAPPSAAAAVWTDGLLLEFLFGMVLALGAERGWRLGAPAALALALLGLAAALALGPASGRFDAWPSWLRGGAPAALVVGGSVLGPRWPAGRAVAALALVGDSSYSLYLSHPFAVRLLRAGWLAVLPAGAPPALYLALACAAALAAALAVHRWIERPLTEALGRRIGAAGGPYRPILPEAAAAAEAARSP